MVYEGKDISRNIAPYLINFTYTDNAKDKADDISVTLEDRKGRWRDPWFPTKGDKITASIAVREWKKPDSTESLPCGTFEVTQIECSGPPTVVTIRGVSTLISKPMCSEKHTKAWENTKLSVIAEDVANKSGLKLYFDCPENPLFERKDQVEKSDLDFFSDLCKECGVAVKVSDTQLVCYDEAKNEAREAAGELKFGDKKIISYRFSSKASGVYTAAHLQYHNPAKNENIEVTVKAEEAEGTARVLELNEKADSIAEAKNLAEKKLRDANNKEITGSINMMGDMRFLGGNNINISGFGAFDGKYLIERATHSVSGGYTTSLELRMGETEKKAAKEKKKKKQAKSGAASAPLYYTGSDVYGG